MDGQQGREPKGHGPESASPTAGDRTRCTCEKPSFADQTNLRNEGRLSWVCKRGCHPARSPGQGLRWGGHDSRRAIAQCLPNYSHLQG